MKKRVAPAMIALLLSACGGGSSSGSAGTPTASVPTPAPTPTPTPVPTPTPSGPNVLFIVADDLNDYEHFLGGHPQAYTPNLDRLAARGVNFTNAQANGVICAPSRASFLSGYLPSTSGKYQSTLDFTKHPILANARMLPEHFRDNGYAVYLGGKVFDDIEKDNGVYGTSDRATWPKSPSDRTGGYIGPPQSFGPYPWDGILTVKGEPIRVIPYGVEGRDWQRNTWDGASLLPGGRWNTNPDLPVNMQGWQRNFGRISQPPTFTAGMNSAYPAGWSYKGFGNFRYVSAIDRSLLADEQIANWVAALLRGTAQPDPQFAGTAPIAGRRFMITMGLTKTHFSLYVPDEYYDKVIEVNGIKSIDDVKLPDLFQGKLYSEDYKDIPDDLRYGNGFAGEARLLKGGNEGGVLPDPVHPGQTISNTQEHLLKSVILAYLAAIYEVDVQVGKVLDALDSNPALRANTIIVFTSDQGFHFGTKNYFDKGSLWDETTHVPLIIVDPAKQFDASRGKTSGVAASLVDLYPTLVQLAGLPAVPIASGSPPLDGQSLMPALVNPDAPAMARTPTAISSRTQIADTPQGDAAQRDHSIRTDRWRYTLGKSGSEELYDEIADPHEWTNLAKNPAYQAQKDALKQLLTSEVHR